MKKLLILLVILATSQTGILQAKTAESGASKWNADPMHSSVKFTVSHLTVSEVEGRFKIFNGSIEAPTADFQNANINFSVDVNSINTDQDDRDKHLKSDDFFNAEKYPQMKFVSTSFKKVKGNEYTLEGNLTIRDVTKKVKFAVTYGGIMKDPYGNIKSGFKASGKIKRSDYNLKWNKLTEAGGMIVGDEVSMVLNLEFAQAK